MRCVAALQYEELLRIVDADGSGAIDYLEFANTIKPVDETDDEGRAIDTTVRPPKTFLFRGGKESLFASTKENFFFFRQGASAAGATKDVPYVHWSDLRPPATLDVFGKSVEIHDADPFTKRFFALQVSNPDQIREI